MATETTTWLDELRAGDTVILKDKESRVTEAMNPFTVSYANHYEFGVKGINGTFAKDTGRNRVFVNIQAFPSPLTEAQQAERDRKSRIKHITDALPTLSQSQLERVAAIVEEGAK